jgi:cell division protein FtsW
MKPIDYTIFFLTLGLIVFGMIMISSVSVYPSFKVTSLMVASGKLLEPNNHFYLIRNISHVVLGLLTFAFVAKTPYTFFEKYSKHLFLGSLLLLLAVLFIGVAYNGAKGWINVPFLPFSLQPVEFAKLGIVLYFSAYLKRKKAVISDFFNGFLPYM